LGCSFAFARSADGTSRSQRSKRGDGWYGDAVWQRKRGFWGGAWAGGRWGVCRRLIGVAGALLRAICFFCCRTEIYYYGCLSSFLFIHSFFPPMPCSIYILPPNRLLRLKPGPMSPFVACVKFGLVPGSRFLFSVCPFSHYYSYRHTVSPPLPLSVSSFPIRIASRRVLTALLNEENPTTDCNLELIVAI